ncbi:CdaR family protein [Peptoniphilaceae bacterium SGI.131]
MNLLKNNWKQKLLSLILAIVLWGFVVAGENPTVTTRMTEVPIVIDNAEDLENKGLVLMPNYRKYIDVMISGKRNQIINMTPSHIRVTADLAGLGEGTHNVRLKYSLPTGVNLESESQVISAEIQKLISKDFSVNVDKVGNLPAGYLIESIKATPEKITLRGARSTIDSITNLSASLTLNQVEDDIVTNVDVVAMNSEGQKVDNITYGQKFVNLTALILKQKEVSININTATDTLNPDYKLKNIAINPSKVYIKGKKELVDKLKEVDTQDIDLSDVSKSGVRKVKLELPSGISLTDAKLEFLVDFELEGKIKKEISLSTSNIGVSGANGLDYAFNSQTYKITVSGFSQDLESLKAGDFKASLDLSGKSSGLLSLKPSVSTDKDVEITSVENISIVLN